MKKSVTVKRGPLSGMEVTLVRRHRDANAWMARVDNYDEHPLVMVWDWELVETVERKPRTPRKGR